jgi:hypothetical protein
VPLVQTDEGKTNRREAERKRAEGGVNMQKLESLYSDMTGLIYCLLDSTKTNGLIVESAPGLRKSYVVLQTLKARGLEEDKDFVVVSGYVTPLEFYKLICDYADKLIVIDDVESILTHDETTGLLLPLLWSPTTERIATYASSSSKLEGYPKQCNFKGKVIILTNHVPGKLRAFLSRCFHYKMEINWENRISMMYELAEELTLPKEIVDFIANTTTKETKGVDFRLLFKILDIHKSKPMEWKTLSIAIIHDSSDTRIIYGLRDSGLSKGEQIRKYKELTGESKATYYRRFKSVK